MPEKTPPTKPRYAFGLFSCCCFSGASTSRGGTGFTADADILSGVRGFSRSFRLYHRARVQLVSRYRRVEVNWRAVDMFIPSHADTKIVASEKRKPPRASDDDLDSRLTSQIGLASAQGL